MIGCLYLKLCLFANNIVIVDSNSAIILKLEDLV